MLSLDEIIKNYNFIPKNKNVFYAKPKVKQYQALCDEMFFTKEGLKGYYKLLNLLADIETLTGIKFYDKVELELSEIALRDI